MKLVYQGAEDYHGPNFIAQKGDIVEFPLEIALQNKKSGLWKEAGEIGNSGKSRRGIHSKASSQSNDNRSDDGELRADQVPNN